MKLYSACDGRIYWGIYNIIYMLLSNFAPSLLFLYIFAPNASDIKEHITDTTARLQSNPNLGKII